MLEWMEPQQFCSFTIDSKHIHPLGSFCWKGTNYIGCLYSAQCFSNMICLAFFFFPQLYKQGFVVTRPRKNFQIPIQFLILKVRVLVLIPFTVNLSLSFTDWK